MWLDISTIRAPRPAPVTHTYPVPSITHCSVAAPNPRAVSSSQKKHSWAQPDDCCVTREDHPSLMHVLCLHRTRCVRCRYMHSIPCAPLMAKKVPRSSIKQQLDWRHAGADLGNAASRPDGAAMTCTCRPHSSPQHPTLLSFRFPVAAAHAAAHAAAAAATAAACPALPERPAPTVHRGTRGATARCSDASGPHRTRRCSGSPACDHMRPGQMSKCRLAYVCPQGKGKCSGSDRASYHE